MTEVYRIINGTDQVNRAKFLVCNLQNNKGQSVQVVQETSTFKCKS